MQEEMAARLIKRGGVIVVALWAVLMWPLPQVLCAQSAAHDAKEPKLLAALEAIDRRLVSIELALHQGDAEVEKIQEELFLAEAARAAAAHEVATAQTRLAHRLGALTRMRPTAHIAANSSIRGLNDWVQKEQLLRALSKYDKKIYSAHRAAQLQLQQTIAINEERAASLSMAQAQRRASREALAQVRRRKDRTLKNLRSRRMKMQVAPELQLAQARLQQTIDASSDDNHLALSAKNDLGQPKKKALGWPWPAQGRVRIAFGEHIEGLFGTATHHNGWDIAAAAGSEVQAVAAGKVAYAQWLTGYGQVAIIEHANKMHTVHGHLSRLQVQKGQNVRPGQVLGQVGDTGSLRGTVLYFEIRRAGVPQDPRQYLARR